MLARLASAEAASRRQAERQRAEGGGKTTLMFRLAKELIQGGKRVITTTTTKILEPAPDETECLFVESDEEKLKEWVRGHVPEYKNMTLARERLGTGKLKGISPALALD